MKKNHAIVTDAPRPTKRDPAQEKPPRPLAAAQFVAAAAAFEQLPPLGPPEIAFAGRSNSGKSSAINALAGQTRLAFTSRTPGRTQQINFFALRDGGMIVDLPGYGYAAVSRALKQTWQDFLWRYVTTRDTLIGMVVVVDARHGLRAPDFDLLQGFLPSGRPVLILATKSDKLNTTDRRAAVQSIRQALRERFPTHANAIVVETFSATTRTGVDAANRTIDAWLPKR